LSAGVPLQHRRGGAVDRLRYRRTKRIPFAIPFCIVTINHHFTKTGSGQRAQKKLRKRGAVFAGYCEIAPPRPPSYDKLQYCPAKLGQATFQNFSGPLKVTPQRFLNEAMEYRCGSAGDIDSCDDYCAR
jgi:hypothetical protein